MRKKVGIHQPNFIPWLPYFHKMAKCDVFIILAGVQFEKNGFQNRYNTDGVWVTNPVKRGMNSICEKEYTNGESLLEINCLWIEAICRTLGIETEVIVSKVTKKFKSKTEMLIAMVKMVGGNVYVTNPDAKNKYLDEDLMRQNGIEIEYCKTPKDMCIHIFDAFKKYGIKGTKEQLGR